MKHRIVGDHHQLLAVELTSGEELLVFNTQPVFSRGDVALVEPGRDFAGTGLGDARLLTCQGDKGMMGIVPRDGGHLKRIEVGPQSGMVARAESIFVLSRGVNVTPYKASPEVAGLLGELGLVTLMGMGMGFLKTHENFIEFTLGSGEDLKADAGHIVAFSSGIKINPLPSVSGRGTVLFTGPGHLILRTG